MNNLKKLRLEKGLYQKDIALFLSISPTTYTGYETGYRKPTPEILCKLADFFNVSVDYILERDQKEDLLDTKGLDLNNNIIAERLIFLRKSKNLSQQKLAELTQISQSAIAKWELGKTEPTATALQKISKYFSVSSDYVLGRENIEDIFENGRVSNKVSLNLKSLRIKNNLKQIDIANALGISIQNYSRYERNEVEPDYKTLILFADFFNVSVDYLLDREINSNIDLHMKNLKNIRKTKNITQVEMAKMLNVTQASYSEYETGRSKPSYETLIKICRILECSADYLLGISKHTELENLYNVLNSTQQECLISYAKGMIASSQLKK